MRLLQVCKHFHPRVTGVTAHVEHLGRELKALGHEVGVAAWGDKPGRESLEGLEVWRARSGDSHGLLRLVQGFQPDLIHVHSIWEPSLIGAKAACKLSRPYVVTTHGTWQLLAGGFGAGPWLDRLRREVWVRHVIWPRLLRGAGAVIVLNALEEEDAVKAGVPLSRILRIPNAVDLDLFHPRDLGSTNGSRAGRLGPTILFAGAMEENKGVFEALEAAALLRAGHPGVRWLFCGSGPDLERAKIQAGEIGLDGVAEFTGQVSRDKMPEIYRQADLVVVPSREEAFATVLLEAMASGLPCVGTDVGGTPDIISDSQTGFLVPPGDSRALAQMAGWLVEHPQEAAGLGRAGRVRAEEEFAWPTVAGRIAEAYRLAMTLVLVLALMSICRSALALELAPLDILTMIDPSTGLSVVQESPDWRSRNPVWDGRTVGLAAARGEVAAFQLVFLPEPGERLQDIRLGVDLAGLTWRAYRAWPIWGVPEVAVLLGQDHPAFDLPGNLPGEQEAEKDFRAFTTVVEIEVPRGQPSGDLDGQIQVIWHGGERRLPLRLSVLPLALPKRPGFTLEMNSYGDYLRLLPSDRETYLGLHRLFRHFRCTFTLVPYRQDGSPILDFLAPAVDSDGRLDFTTFDKSLAGLFDGTAFADRQPLSHFLLPLRAGWPAAYGGPPGLYAARNITARQALARHILDKGWSATRFQEFHNENPEHGAKVPWRLDEPASDKDLAGHEMFLDYVSQACQNLACRQSLRYRVDISDWRPLRPDLRDMAGRVTDWSISADPRFLDSQTVRFFQDLGGQWLMAYGELGGFQTHGRPTPWSAFVTRLARFYLLGLNGYAQWQVDRWRTSQTTDMPLAQAALNASSAAGARDFIWPGLALGLTGPLPSLRLFALREAINIFDYLNSAEKVQPRKAREFRRRLATLDGVQAGEIYAFKAELAEIAVSRGSHEAED